MIASPDEYTKAQLELNELETRLAKLNADHPPGTKGFTKAGVRKMIARLHEELAVFEASGSMAESD